MYLRQFIRKKISGNLKSTSSPLPGCFFKFYSEKTSPTSVKDTSHGSGPASHRPMERTQDTPEMTQQTNHMSEENFGVGHHQPKEVLHPGICWLPQDGSNAKGKASCWIFFLIGFHPEWWQIRTNLILMGYIYYMNHSVSKSNYPSISRDLTSWSNAPVRRRYALAIAMVCLSINSGLSSLHQAEWPCQASTLWRFPAMLLEPVFAPWKERTYDTNQLNSNDSIKTTRVRSISPCLCHRMVVELCTLCKDRKRSLGRWVKEKHEVLLSYKTCQQSRNKKSSASV